MIPGVPARQGERLTGSEQGGWRERLSCMDVIQIEAKASRHGGQRVTGLSKIHKLPRGRRRQNSGRRQGLHGGAHWGGIG